MFLMVGYEEGVTPYWHYGDKGHVFTSSLRWSYADEEGETREFFCADTWEPLTRKQVAARIREHEQWMEIEDTRRRNHMRV
jgi:hypothetical protein